MNQSPPPTQCSIIVKAINDMQSAASLTNYSTGTKPYVNATVMLFSVSVVHESEKHIRVTKIETR
jgi:hypothetical protein